MQHLNDEDLVLLALGEAATESWDADAPRDHLRSCERCRAEFEALRHVVELGRETDAQRGPAPIPPPSVWAGIAQELTLPGQTPPTPGPPTDAVTRRAERPHAARRWLIAASIAAAVVLGVGAGVLIGRASVDRPPSTTSTATAALAPVPPAGPSDASGTATITRGPNGATLKVATARLPLQQGFYQVWLYDQAAEKMVPIGTLDGTGQGTFTLTPSIDVRSFNIVDISAQQLNGDPAHGSSVLRGDLTQ